MAQKDNGFEVVFRDGAQLKEDGIRQILLDTETGVNYLLWKSGYAGGITPLLDSRRKRRNREALATTSGRARRAGSRAPATNRCSRAHL